MSLQAMLWSLDQMDVTAPQKLILVVLSDHCGRDGECFPHLEKIAARCCLSKRAVVENLAKLEELGKITRERRRKGGRQTTTCYRLALQSAPDAPSQGAPYALSQGAPDAPCGEAQSAPGAPHRVHLAPFQSAPGALGVSVLSLEPPNEPPKENLRRAREDARAPEIDFLGSRPEENPEGAMDHWTPIKAELRKRLSVEDYRTYVRPLEVEHAGPGRLVLRAPNPKFAALVDRGTIREHLDAAAAAVAGPELRVEVSSPDVPPSPRPRVRDSRLAAALAVVLAFFGFARAEALTPNQIQARAAAVALQAAGFGGLTSCMPTPALPQRNCGEAIHGNHVYLWLGEAVFGTGLSSPAGDGAFHVDDRLRNAAMETTWGQGIYQLYVTDRAASAGWAATSFGLRATWWKNARHERNGTEKLTGIARNGQRADIAAVPGSGMSAVWPTTAPPPESELEWAAILRTQVLFPDQYEVIRKHLGIPAVIDPPQSPNCPDGSRPPCVVVPPTCPNGQPPPCVVDPPDPPATWIEHVRAALRRAVADLEAALAAMPPESTP